MPTMIELIPADLTTINVQYQIDYSTESAYFKIPNVHVNLLNLKAGDGLVAQILRLEGKGNRCADGDRSRYHANFNEGINVISDLPVLIDVSEVSFDLELMSSSFFGTGLGNSKSLVGSFNPSDVNRYRLVDYVQARLRIERLVRSDRKG